MAISIGVGPPPCTSSPKGYVEGAQNQCRAALRFHHHHHRRPHLSCLQFNKISFSSRCNIGLKFVVTPPRICKSLHSPKPRQAKDRSSTVYVSGVDNLGLEPLAEENCSEEEDDDASEAGFTSESSEKLSISEQIEVATANETTSSQCVGTNGSPIPDDETSREEVTQSRRMSGDEDGVENWQIFAAEEGARQLTGPIESDQDSWDTEQENGTDSDVEDGLNQGGVKRRKAEDLLSLPDGKPGNWTPAEAEKVKFLHKYEYRHVSDKGVFVVQAMRPEHMNATEELLVDSFAELMGGLLTYRPLLALTVKQYVCERYTTLPYSVTLVGLFAPAEENSGTIETNGWAGNWVVAGTVELSFSVSGHPYLPSPAPPSNAPYICNMAVTKDYRRRGLGRQMLKAAEDLAMTMDCQDMYLHCRMVDTTPLNMYQNAGYQVVSTDSLLSVLTLQRRRHLLRKRLSRAKLVPDQ